ncbi:hypothetical protein [Streptomyces sp. SID1121]
MLEHNMAPEMAALYKREAVANVDEVAALVHASSR